MTDKPNLPPLYRPIAVAAEHDPFERGVMIAAEGAEPGTILWSVRTDDVAAAIVLAPEHARARSLPVLQVALPALADALDSLLSPVLAVTFEWPDQLRVNGIMVGGVRLAVAPAVAGNDVPDWLVIGVELRLRPMAGLPDMVAQPDDTLAEQGYAEISPIEVLETFSRHFLGWLALWQEDGVSQIHQAWLARVPRLGLPVRLSLGGSVSEGVFSGITESGDLRLNDGAEVVSLEQATQHPSWAA